MATFVFLGVVSVLSGLLFLALVFFGLRALRNGVRASFHRCSVLPKARPRLKAFWRASDTASIGGRVRVGERERE